jgi:beta-lactamase superfamily II metal-dependent hydrolase
VTVSLVDKEEEEEGSDAMRPAAGGRPLPLTTQPTQPTQPSRKRKEIGATNAQQGLEKKARVAINLTHRVKITMVQAGKGDCYVVSETAGDQTRHLLVDGGIDGTWKAHLQPTLTQMTVGKLSGVVCTHFDADHIQGLNEMTKSAGCPKFASFLFNDPAFDIPTQYGQLPKNCSIVGKEPLKIDERAPVGGPSRLPLSISQGIQLLGAARGAGTDVVLRGPCAPGGAIPRPGRDDATLFDQLNTTFFGPNEANIDRAMARIRAGVKSTPVIRKLGAIRTNRLSTVMVLSTKDDRIDFTALFTGDAHDHLPSRLDIRADVKAPQHFSVIKVPHHGSDRSSSPDFFRQYTADVYLISTRYNAHKLPTLTILNAILEGCERKGIRPILITTSVHGSSGIERLMRIQGLLNRMRRVGAKMFFFNNSMDSFAITFNNGRLEDLDTAAMVELP